MRKVMVSKVVKNDQGKWEQQEYKEASFHQFGVDYEEFENGPANYSTAIVEYDDGTIGNVPVHLVRFLN